MCNNNSNNRNLYCSISPHGSKVHCINRIVLHRDISSKFLLHPNIEYVSRIGSPWCKHLSSLLTKQPEENDTFPRLVTSN